jgi:hypothetical protein
MDNTQSPFLSQEDAQELAEQQLETITGGGGKVVSPQEFGKPYADAYNSASEQLRQPFLTANSSAANQVSGRMLAAEVEKPLHEAFFPPIADHTESARTGRTIIQPSRFANDELRAILKK